MAETTAPPPAVSLPPSNNNTSTSTDIPGQPFYDRTKQHLKELLRRKQILERNLQATEELIYKNETEYLEDTPAGNIIIGFEGYTKGTGAVVGAGRRKGNVVEGNRVFSRCSVSFGPADSPSNTATSTPLPANVPTPISTNLGRGEGGSSQATPTSARSVSGMGKSAGKKNKKTGDDSDGEGSAVKKIRTNFGAVRK
ncbi:hypothetical protein HYALB_00004803 [Hymenoscyphus albidus]|uniref:Chromatin modification-related protein EAF6 n=1 Tax=Hymenoscyphus albidus TaxID=595503 RepID=A0A9N9LHW0_9HELO|nr:hypothetical protein HYALB_00004803 [Hymenoscyphus albidus]